LAYGGEDGGQEVEIAHRAYVGADHRREKPAAKGDVADLPDRPIHPIHLAYMHAPSAMRLARLVISREALFCGDARNLLAVDARRPKTTL
jgi:hypothetical protein